jgi:Zn-dependent alcohol dehydrogenase
MRHCMRRACGARGRTGVPKILDGYMENQIDMDDLIAHTVALEDINRVRADDARRVEPQGRSVMTLAHATRAIGKLNKLQRYRERWPFV